MNETDNLAWLQSWYRRQCDGLWEHSNGIRIDTLDNPGWSLEIDLSGTFWENAEFDTISEGNKEDDWMSCEVRECKFLAHGDPGKLDCMIRVFRDWISRLPRES